MRVLIVDDSTAEETEIFTVLLSTGDTDSPAVATVTILDNDAIPSLENDGENAFLLNTIVEACFNINNNNLLTVSTTNCSKWGIFN